MLSKKIPKGVRRQENVRRRPPPNKKKGWVCGSMRSTKICGVLKKIIIVDDVFIVVLLLVAGL